jgi:hypothetical protein
MQGGQEKEGQFSNNIFKQQAQCLAWYKENKVLVGFF